MQSNSPPEKTLSSFEFKLLSHPKKLLKEHLTNVLLNGRAFYQNLPLTAEFSTLFDLSLILHDLGKATTFFQEYLRLQEAEQLGTITQKEKLQKVGDLGYKKNHARISAIWAYWISEHLFTNQKLSSLVFISVLNHHGHFRNFKEMFENPVAGHKEDLLAMSQKLDYQEFSEILKMNGFSFEFFNHSYFEKHFGELDSRKFRRQLFPKVCEQLTRKDFYLASLLFSILLSSDKGECIFDGRVYQRTTEKFPPDLISIYKKNSKIFPSIGIGEITLLNELREKIYQGILKQVEKINLSQRFYSINVPTGLGKTLAVMNAAIQLVEKHSSLKKIIYCLPFTSIIDQTSHIFEQVLKENGREITSDELLINHHLTELFYRNKTDQEEYDDYRGEYLIHQFESNFNITTFYQFLYGIFTGRNREIRKLQSFANSVIILDEVQNIPPRYWELVQVVLKELAEELNCVFILMTATMPLIFSESDGEIAELVENKESIFKEMKRIQLETDLLAKEWTLTQFSEHLLVDIQANPDKSFLVIVNTKKSAEFLFNQLKEKNLSLIYLSTNIPPYERLKRIQCIKDAQERYVVITTQLIEAGVDVDLDVVYRDLAPLDSIFQSAGRCNRNSKQTKGRVKLVHLINEEHQNRSFASYIYSIALLNATKSLLQEKTVFDESDFYPLAKLYFERMRKNLISQKNSHYLLEQMAKLNYQNAFEIKKENDKKCKDEQSFQLIEDTFFTVPAYLNYTPEAKDLYKTFLDLQNQQYSDPFEKKFKIKQQLRKMSQFMINLPKKYLEKTETNFVVIDENRSDFQYDENLGLVIKGFEQF